MATEQETLDGPDEAPPWWRTVPLILAILLALALALIIYLADSAAQARDRAIASQRHSFEVMMLASELEGTIANSEALLARYVVSLDRRTGTQYQDEWRNAQAELLRLEHETADNVRQRRNLVDLRQAITERGKTLNDLALRATYKQKENLLGRFYTAGKSPVIGRIRDALHRTVEEEKAALARHNVAVDQSENRVNSVNTSYALVGLGLLVAALLALWFAYGAGRERRFARRLAQAEANRVDGLEHAVRQRTEQLETVNLQLRREMEERARAEQTLRHFQKMEAIGKLTGGIAHDFNNMLAAIVGGIDLARRGLHRDLAKARQHLDHAMESANRAATLTSRLLAFARPDSPAARKTDIDELIANMRQLIERATDDGITVTFDLDAGEGPIWLDPAQLENAILNLVINARDAMEGRGSLTITTRGTSLARNEIGQCHAGRHVSISVTDTGCGMTQEVIDRAFEPFFTTKPVGKGTGLGLAQLFGFVRGAGGEIEVHSVPGEGTTMRVLLPRDVQPGVDMSREPAPSPLALGLDDDLGVLHEDGKARLILVVEDDPRVLRATMGALDALGHQGIGCDHPGKASALLGLHPETALIISDMLMPDMTGPEMIAALGDAWHGKPILFVTGFGGEGERATQLSGIPILHKPFTVAQLDRAIEDVLTAPRAPHPAVHEPFPVPTVSAH